MITLNQHNCNNNSKNRNGDFCQKSLYTSTKNRIFLFRKHEVSLINLISFLTLYIGHLTTRKTNEIYIKKIWDSHVKT